MFDGPSHWLTKSRRTFWKGYVKTFVLAEVTVHSKPAHDFDWTFCRCRGCRGNRRTHRSHQKTYRQMQEQNDKYNEWSRSKNEVWPWQ